MDNNVFLEKNDNDKHARPSTDVRAFEIGDTPTITSPSSTSSTGLVVSGKPDNEIDENDDDIIVVPHQTTSARRSDAVAGQPAARGFDPAQIPASVFGPKASTPMEWSFASNESLFSIHVANTSLSKDQFLNIFRSGELTRFDQELARFSGVVSSEMGDQSYAESMLISSDPSRERDHFDWRYNATAQSFQFPVLVGSYDSGMISSPNMEPRRHRAMEKWHNPTQPSSPAQIIQSREQSRRFDTKQPEHNGPNWLFCLTCCFKPCR